MIEFEILGVPIPLQRARAFSQGGHIKLYDSQKKEKAQMQWRARLEYREDPLPMPLILYLTYCMPIPKGTSKIRTRAMLYGDLLPAKKPDLDNLIKMTNDFLNGLLYEDDRQIVEIHAKKIYSDIPRTIIKAIPCKELFEQGKDEATERDD